MCIRDRDHADGEDAAWEESGVKPCGETDGCGAEKKSRGGKLESGGGLGGQGGQEEAKPGEAAEKERGERESEEEGTVKECGCGWRPRSHRIRLRERVEEENF